MDTILTRKKVNNETVLLFITLILYKFIIEYGFLKLLFKITPDFTYDFNLAKYIFGFAWIIVMFLVIDHSEKKASTFLLDFQMFIAMVPITTIYAFSNENTLYYCFLCVGFCLCSFCARKGLPNSGKPRNIKVGKLPDFFIVISLLCMFGVLIAVIATRGLPTLVAINMSNVYDLRGEDYFISNTYLKYAYNWMMVTLAPFVFAFALVKRKYLYSFICVFYILIFYLYSGNKSTFFSVFLILGIYVFMRFRKGNFRFYQIFSLGVLGVTVLGTFLGRNALYSLLVRRTMLLPANLKFIYYEFFSQNPKIGLTNIFPGGIFGDSPYADAVTNIIGEMYFKVAENNANTGFMAEGYERFGYVGIIIAFLMFAFILMMIDKLQHRTSFIFAVTMSIYPIFRLTDGPLISSILCGPMLLFLLICLFYYNDDMKKETYEHGIKVCTG